MNVNKKKHSLRSDLVVYGIMILLATAVTAEWVGRNV